MTKKKTIFTLLIGVLLLSILSGCGAKKEDSSTVKWINTTYAVLTAANNGDINQVGGYKVNDENAKIVRAGLESSWGITGRASALENLNWLLQEGDRATFADEFASLKDSGIMEMTSEQIAADLRESGSTEDEIGFLVAMLEAYHQYGDTAVDAWDHCRALQLLGWYAVAGYYTEEEALNESLVIAQQLQEKYSSWDEMVESYMLGYNYWSEDNPENPESATAARRQVYESLKASNANPYTLDWKTPLENTWGKQ